VRRRRWRGIELCCVEEMGAARQREAVDHHIVGTPMVIRYFFFILLELADI